MPRLTRLSFPMPLVRELLDRVTADDADIRLSKHEVQRLIEKTKTSRLEKEELRALLGVMAAERETDNIESYVEIREACFRDWYGPENMKRRWRSNGATTNSEITEAVHRHEPAIHFQVADKVLACHCRPITLAAA